jgi:glycosyltransferase involved in cell wall biosynthesis
MRETPKIKIFFILPSLRPGGAERILSYLASNLDKELFNTKLIIIGYPADTSYNIDNVETIFLKRGRVLSGAWPLLRLLKRESPDIAMTSIGHLNTLAGIYATLFPSIKFIAREDTIQSIFSKYSKRKKIFPLHRISLFAYKNLERVVCQSKDMYIDLMKRRNLPMNKVVTIPNPAPNSLRLKKTTKRDEIIKFITIGRLSPEKGHLRLLENLAKSGIRFSYTIIGKGQEKDRIEEKARALGIDSSIEYVPFTDKVDSYLIEHDVFLQGSYVEGFPNAIMESCVCGVPVLAFNVPGGTWEIIEEGVNGFLAEDDADFLERLDQIILHNWNPLAIRESIYKKFHSERVLKMYEELFKEVSYNK